MKVEAAPSFFKSLKSINSFKSKWYSFIGWFKYHFNKENWNLMKEVWKGRPRDCDYLYYLEKVKIEEMIAYHTKANRYVVVEEDIKWMKLAVKLIDIITGETSLFGYTGDVKWNKLEDGNYEMDNSDLVYHCYVNVNTKNGYRFIPQGKTNPHLDYWITNGKHEIYRLKAKALYHKIRNEKDEAWWD